MTIAQRIIKAVEHLSEDEQREVLSFAEALRQGATDDKRLGEAGLRAAADVWAPEDFSDWEPSVGR